MNDRIHNLRISDYATKVEIYETAPHTPAGETAYASIEEGDALDLIEDLLDAIERDGPADMIKKEGR